MMELLAQWQSFLEQYPPVYSSICGLLLLMVAILSYQITHVILMRLFIRLLRMQQVKGSADRRIRRKLIPRVCRTAPLVVISLGVVMIPNIPEEVVLVVQNLCNAFIIITISMAIASILDMCEILYHTRQRETVRPIKGYLQLVKIIVYVVAVVLVIASLVNKSPLILLSGIGAVAAVLMLIFQDTILAVVAGVQISSNDMVRIGDWIEMPAQNADGNVVEIALHTVKVQNWDNTVTTLPVRKLITDSFKNWRYMTESGGRQIKRSLYIDQRSVRFLSDEEVDNLTSFVLLNDYLGRKHKEISEWNARLNAEGANPINGRRVTNLGTFRAYVDLYLKNHPYIHKNMTLLVRQLQPGDTGIPLQIYCYTNDVRWVAYENIQSDIFDHLLAILPIFGLRVYQRSSDAGSAPPTPTLGKL